MRRDWMSSSPAVLLLVMVLLPAATACDRGGAAGGRRVVVLGIDGMDYRVTERLMGEGRMPNFTRLAEAGSFGPLETAVPPQSPVAWSDFITGFDAGGHGIFDFIHRDPETMVPYLSTSRTVSPEWVIPLGDWKIPLDSGDVELLRRGTPFWQALEAEGIRTTIARMPANFPPSGEASRELSGMGTPDLTGTPGWFHFYTTRPERIRVEVTGGTVYPVRVRDGVVRARIVGPDNPFRVESDPVGVDFIVYVDPSRPVAKVAVDGQEVLLVEGEWSRWMPVHFELVPWVQSLPGMVRFYLKSVRPDFELYVTPINIDPLAPAMPISTPADFAAELATATGRYYTQEMPQDTKALREGIFTDDEFLMQADLVADEYRRQFEHLLGDFEEGLLFYYFGGLDQVSHMMWRAMDPEHPAHDPVADAPYRDVIERLYVEADEIVGYTLEHISADTQLVVMSDHGFASWRRAFNLNTWLLENDYVQLLVPRRQGEYEFFGNVDWSRTRAYGLGLNGLYINLRGRERLGVVAPEQRRALIDEIADKLLSYVDPATGEPAVTRVYRRDQFYGDRGEIEAGPDLVVGYAKGTRGSDASALGEFPLAVVADNTDKWSGDHCMDHTAVPGVLLVKRPLVRPAASLKDLGATLLAEFGIEGFPSTGSRAASDERTGSR